MLNCYSNYKLWCSVNFFPWHYYEPHFLTKSRINNSNIFCFNYQSLMGHNKTKLSGAEKNNLMCTKLPSAPSLPVHISPIVGQQYVS